MKISLFAFVLLLLSTCQDRQSSQAPLTQQEIDNRLMEINEQMTSNEKDRIEKYVEEQGWEMTETGTGLRYWIYKDEPGAVGVKGQTASIGFKVNLLDGTECYRTEDGESRDFRIEQSDVETGLHEVMQYLSEGDQAKVILPSHLAYGLAGDMNKIPLKSTLVYDIELYSLK